MVFEGYNGRITLEGDDLVISRDGVKGRFGGDLERRIPLDDVEGAFLSPPPEPKRPGYLQLVLADEDEQELTQSQAIVHPDVVTFSARQQPAFERLHDWLENGGELDEAPAAAATVPVPVPAPAPAPASGAPATPAPTADPFAARAADPFAAPPAGAAPVASPYAAAAVGYGAAPVAAGPRPGLVEAVRLGITRFADFTGRSRRSEYWWFVLASSLVQILAAVLDGVLGTSALGPIAFFGLLVPTLALVWRRLHDTGRYGGWFFLVFAPFGGIVLLVWLCFDSKPGANQWGPNPKGL